MSNNQDGLQPVSSPDQSGFAAGLLLGLVIGGAGGYFLTTPQGRALLKQLTEQAGDKFEDLKKTEIFQSLVSKLETLPVSEDVVELAKEKLRPKAPPKKRLFFSGGSPVKK
jgi:hypothetical protein